MKTAIVIPSYNEERTVSEVVRRAAGQADVIFVIDDGSSDRTALRAREAGAEVVSHVVNRGLGASIGTGLAAALAAGAEVMVTLDADLQHDPAEVPKLVEPIISDRADVVIGSRLLTATSMPGYRQIENRLGNLVTFALFGIRCSDTQSGFRAFSRRAAEMIQIETDGMEVSSEILRQTKRLGLRLVEVPIGAHYSTYSLGKGQNLGVGVRTAWKLFMQRIKTRNL